MTIRLREVLGGAQPLRARAMARKRKASEAECRARKSPTTPTNRSAILSEIRRCVASIQLALRRLAGRRSSTQQTTGFHLAPHDDESLQIGW
jgi:hypothetical protein